jgi:hypothetical protein
MFSGRCLATGLYDAIWSPNYQIVYSQFVTYTVCKESFNKPGSNCVLTMEHQALSRLRNVGALSRCVFISFTRRSSELHHVHTICFVNRDQIRNVVSAMAQSLLHMCDWSGPQVDQERGLQHPHPESDHFLGPHYSFQQYSLQSDGTNNDSAAKDSWARSQL